MTQNKSKEAMPVAQNKQLAAAGKSGMMPPAFQLKADEQKSDQKLPGVGTMDKPADLTGLSILQMHEKAKLLAAEFDRTDSLVAKFQLARVLYPIYQILNHRGLLQATAAQPDYSDEIWQVVGGPGDPMVGMLDSYAPYDKAFEWDKAMKQYDPQSWSEEHVNAAYFGNKTKSGEARATNYGTGVEEARSLIGQEVSYVDKEGKPKKRIFSPEIKAGSEWGAQNGAMVRNPDFNLSLSEMMEIVNEDRIRQSIAGRKAEREIQAKSGRPLSPEPPTMEKVYAEVGKFTEKMRLAFRLAKIDTVQGQASYLAHAAGETLFLGLTEGQGEMLESDPHQLTYKMGANGPMDYARSSENAELKRSTRSVDPLGGIGTKAEMRGKDQGEVADIMNQTFIGRGPVQVTHDYNYTQTLIYMEELAKTAETKEDADKLWEAVLRIKQDPSQAANPEYSFLFSAAYMQRSTGVQASGRLGTRVANIQKGVAMNGEQHALFDWVSGGMDIGLRTKPGSLTDSVFHAANRKVDTYNKAVEVITRHLMNKKQP